MSEKRFTINKLRNHKKIIKTCTEHGVSRKTFISRMHAGWNMEKAITLKPRSEEAKQYALELRRLRKKIAEAEAETKTGEKYTKYNAYKVPIKGIIW